MTRSLRSTSSPRNPLHSKRSMRVAHPCAATIVSVLFTGAWACSGGHGATIDCTGDVRCACFPNGTCNDGLSCLSSVCVAATGASASGASGSGSTSTAGGGSSGSAGASSGGAGGSSAGTSSTAGGGSSSSASSSGSNGSSSSSMGSSSSSTSSGDTCGGAPATVIDNFYACSGAICDLGGRSGSWFNYASADVNQTFAVSEPPSGFVDRACAAWSTGGPLSGITSSTTYAGIGFTLVPGGATYDLSGYTGVNISMESGQNFHFVVEDSSGGYFGAEMLGGGNGAVAFQIPFSSLTMLANSQTTVLDLANAIQMEFDADTPQAYGCAIHSVSLY